MASPLYTLADCSRKRLKKIGGWSQRCQDEVEEFWALLSHSLKIDINNEQKKQTGNEKISSAINDEPAKRPQDTSQLLASVDRQSLEEPLRPVVAALNRIRIDDYYDMLKGEQPSLLKKYSIQKLAMK